MRQWIGFKTTQWPRNGSRGNSFEVAASGIGTRVNPATGLVEPVSTLTTAALSDMAGVMANVAASLDDATLIAALGSEEKATITRQV